MSAIHKGYTSCIVSNQAYSVLVKSCIHIVYMFQVHVTCLRLHVFFRQIFIYGAIFISHAQPLPHHSHPTCSVKHMYPKIFVRFNNCVFQGRARQEPQYEDLYTLYIIALRRHPKISRNYVHVHVYQEFDGILLLLFSFIITFYLLTQLAIIPYSILFSYSC